MAWCGDFREVRPRPRRARTPAEIPWISRPITTITGASAPIVAYPGTRRWITFRPPSIPASHQAGATAIMVDIRAEEKATEWAHQKAGPECQESKTLIGANSLRSGRRSSDRARVITKNKKVVHLQEVSAGHAHDRPDLLLSLGAAEAVPSRPFVSAFACHLTAGDLDEVLVRIARHRITVFFV